MSWKRYGPIVIAGGVAVTGVLWHNGGRGVSGEDAAYLVAAVTERGLTWHEGTNAYSFASNSVPAGVDWGVLYGGVLLPARSMVVSGGNANGNGWRIAVDSYLPEDLSAATLDTEHPGPFTSLDSRIVWAGNGVRLAGGLAATNFPITEYLWSAVNGTNARPAYTAGHSPWASGNFWTAAGLGTNVYLWGCEAFRNVTNHEYEITAVNLSFPYTGYFHTGDVFRAAGTVDLSPYPYRARKYVSATASYPLYYVDDTGYWSAGPDGYGWFKQQDAWPDIGRLAYAETGMWLDMTRHTTVSNNAPVVVGKGVARSNLDEARNVLTNLCRTVWFGWANPTLPITAERVIVMKDVVAWASEMLPWPPGTSDVQTAYGDYVAGVDAWEEVDGTNAFVSVDKLLERTGAATWALFYVYGGEWAPTGCDMSMQDVSWRYRYEGARVTAYPSDYAFASNYVARVRIYLLLGDAVNGGDKKWRLANDSVNPTERPVFDLDCGTLRAQPPYELDLIDFEDGFGGLGYDGFMMWHAAIEFYGGVSDDVTALGVAVVVDWKWVYD